MTKDRSINTTNNTANEGACAGVAFADVEVIAVAKRRQFSASEKKRILAEAARCTQSGDVGALLRREGIYSSTLHKWRYQQNAALQYALAPKKRGVKTDPSLVEVRKITQLTQENTRLKNKLAQAQTIIDVQKKLCALLGLPTDETPNECC